MKSAANYGVVVMFALAGCGDDAPIGPTDSGTDAAFDSGVDAGHDAGSDAALDGGAPAVDLIMVVDNSGGTGSENSALEAQLNNLVAILTGAGVSTKVVMVTDHGSADTDVCVVQPLGNGNCAGAPGMSADFAHYDVDIGSQDGLCVLLDTYNGSNGGGEADEFGQYPDGWKTALRAGATPVFVVVGNDQVRCGAFDDMETAVAGQAVADAFDIALTALDGSKFGTTANRNYLVHSIVGIPTPTSPGMPLEPSAPIAETSCSGAPSAGTGQQALSTTTGGLRFSYCDLASNAGSMLSTLATRIASP